MTQEMKELVEKIEIIANQHDFIESKRYKLATLVSQHTEDEAVRFALWAIKNKILGANGNVSSI